MAYVLGYFAADGSMLRNRRGGHYIEFTSTDRILLEMVRAATDSSHRISARPLRDPQWKEQFRLQIGCKEWYMDLLALGFTPDKSNTLVFPEVPNTFLNHFIRGYFDGDGCVYFNTGAGNMTRSVRPILLTLFTSGSRQFLEKLWKYLQENGILGGHISPKNRGFDLVFSRNDSLALYRFLYNTGEASEMFLPRKKQKLEEALQVLGFDNACGRSSTG